MAITSGARTRAAAVVLTSVAVTAIAAGPAAATSRDMTFHDGEDRGVTMSAGTAFLLFVGVPLLVAAIVWLLVKAPSWASSARADGLGDGTALPTTSADRPGLVASGQAPAAPDAEASFVPDPADKNMDVDPRPH
ncbi:MAG: hypothetical protein AB7O74_12245 [Candidatus Nanopelagicales bacterium]